MLQLLFLNDVDVFFPDVHRNSAPSSSRHCCTFKSVTANIQNKRIVSDEKTQSCCVSWNWGALILIKHEELLYFLEVKINIYTNNKRCMQQWRDWARGGLFIDATAADILRILPLHLMLNYHGTVISLSFRLLTIFSFFLAPSKKMTHYTV